MKNVFFIGLLYISSCIGFSQEKGNLHIDVSIDEVDTTFRNKIVQILLSKNDSIVNSISGESINHDTDWDIDSLKQGNYKLNILIGNRQYLNFPNIRVDAQQKNTYHFYISSESKRLIKQRNRTDTINVHDDKGEFTFGGMYGNNTNEQANKILQNEIFSGEIATNVYHTLFKYYSIGFKFGYQYSATVFHNDTTHYNGGKIMQKYYSYNNLNIGLINRFTFFNNHKNKDGLKLDLGLIYHFPLSFKQILKINDDTKITTRHIHTYTDFTAMARLGYKYIGLQAEYSLTQFLRHGYTEIPQLRVGLVFYISLSVNR
jgi:hypothetical protein